MRILTLSQFEAWVRFAHEIKGEFLKGSAAKPPTVLVREKEWTLTLDAFMLSAGTSSVPFTRMRAPFVTRDNFWFRIDKRNLLSGIVHLFDRKSLTTGFREFDKAFIIESNDENKLKKLFEKESIRKMVTSLHDPFLEIKDTEGWNGTKLPSDVDELIFETSDIIEEVAQLKSLVHLFAETLNQLVEIGTASERNPNVTLN